MAAHLTIERLELMKGISLYTRYVFLSSEIYDLIKIRKQHQDVNPEDPKEHKSYEAREISSNDTGQGRDLLREEHMGISSNSDQDRSGKIKKMNSECNSRQTMGLPAIAGQMPNLTIAHT